MNKFILTFLLFVMYGLSFGQTEKGRFLVGASSTMDFSRNSHYYYYTMRLKGGYFLANNFALGLEPSLSYFKASSSTNVNKYTSLNLYSFARYYVRVKKFGIFAEVKGGPEFTKSRNKIKDINYKYTETNTYWSFDGGLGVDYFVNDNVAIELNTSLYFPKGESPDFYSTLGFLILF